MFRIALALSLVGLTGLALSARADSTPNEPVRTGQAAFGDWHTDAPGVRRLIAAADLPAPLASKPVANFSSIVSPSNGALPKVPAGFSVEVFASGLQKPRAISVAPNGDIFVAESDAGRIRVFRAGTPPGQGEVFASGLSYPYGIAFYPAGPNPQFIYIGDTNAVVRFPYKNGDVKATGTAQVIVPDIPTGGHSTRDIRFSPDGGKLYVAIGSKSNVADDMEKLDPSKIPAYEAQHGLGAAYGSEQNRADVVETKPDGSGGIHALATGIRNCAGLAVQPGTGDLWCATNERDMLGDDLPPDYATRVHAGGFYGWPWYYIGAHEDPRRKGERPDLAGKITVPDVLFQPHSAPLQIAFYEGRQFPAEYRGSAFVTLHGSWNRANRTGYKVVRLIMKDGKPTGEYEDFLTGLVADEKGVWARPVGVTTAPDGSLLVTEDANGAIWRISYTGRGR